MTYFPRLRWLYFSVLGAVVGVGCGEAPGPDDAGIDICAEVRCDDEDECTENVCDPDDPRVCIFPDAPEDTSCNESGVCDGAGQCVQCNRDEHCPDGFNECSISVCDTGTCAIAVLADGRACAGGVCRAGHCALSGSVVPCTEQGIRNAIAAGGGPYAFACDGPTVVTTVAEIIIDDDVVLDGGGNIVLHGDDAHRVFSVLEGVSAEVRGFRVTRGVATRTIDDQSCGGLANAGTLVLVNSAVSGNTAAAGGGGGICNSGLLTLDESAVEGNTAKACGGVFNNGVAVLRNSTVSGNTAASGGGGGICSSGSLMLVGSTVSGNSAFHSGGIESSGTLTVTNSTVSGNVSEEGSGGIFNIGTAMLQSATVAGNTVAGLRGDIRNAGALAIANTLVDGVCIGSTAAITSEGNNIESPGDTCGLDQETDQIGVLREYLQLRPLADNGGPTMTHALQSGSVAIDRIPEIACEVEEDQRGVARPQGAACDVGAFELELEAP